MSELKAGHIPLVSARNGNNGYKDFAESMGKKGPFKGQCLTINNDGDGGAGISFYQPSDMLLDTHVTALYPKLEMTENILLFISVCITIQREKFGHGYSLNNSRLSAFCVVLPIDENNNPDWDYMERFVSQKKQLLKLQYLKEKGKVLLYDGHICTECVQKDAGHSVHQFGGDTGDPVRYALEDPIQNNASPLF